MQVDVHAARADGTARGRQSSVCVFKRGQRAGPGGAVDVDDDELPGPHADVGLGPALPPRTDLRGVGAGVVHAVLGAWVLAGPRAIRTPARARPVGPGRAAAGPASRPR